MSRTDDTGTLQDLGRASVQIVHDIKNQLNGLKLYATFLRKRLEKSDRPKDEQEVLGKLISGLDRAADDLSIIVRYGRTIELKKQTGVDLPTLLHDICSNLKETSCKVSFESESETLKGEFDAAMLKEALTSICVVATKLRRDKDEPGAITVSVKPGSIQAKPGAIIEWSGLRDLDHDPFKSFAGSDEIKMSLAARIVEAHDGLAQYENKSLVVILPLS
jgi:signal transduction histidine kinase